MIQVANEFSANMVISLSVIRIMTRLPTQFFQLNIIPKRWGKVYTYIICFNDAHIMYSQQAVHPCNCM